MNRREFLTSVATKAAGGAVIGLAAGCSFGATPAVQEAQEAIAQDSALPEIKWEMATSWTPAVDILYGGAQLFADTVSTLTSGKMVITPRSAGELAPGTQVLDVVSQGAVPIGHTASYYYIGKTPATAFGTTVPFGLTAQQQNSWLYAGGGLELMQQLYAEKFNVLPLPAGQTGMQMGGWFRKEINTVADLQGLKMRIAGLGGQVMAKLGVNVQVLPAGEIFHRRHRPYGQSRTDLPRPQKTGLVGLTLGEVRTFGRTSPGASALRAARSIEAQHRQGRVEILAEMLGRRHVEEIMGNRLGQRGQHADIEGFGLGRPWMDAEGGEAGGGQGFVWITVGN